MKIRYYNTKSEILPISNLYLMKVFLNFRKNGSRLVEERSTTIRNNECFSNLVFSINRIYLFIDQSVYSTSVYLCGNDHLGACMHERVSAITRARGRSSC